MPWWPIKHELASNPIELSQISDLVDETDAWWLPDFHMPIREIITIWNVRTWDRELDKG